MTARTPAGAAAAAARRRVIAVLTQLPGVDEEQANRLLAEAGAHRHISLHQVDAYLRERADALRAGAGDMPLALFRLLRHLAQAGAPVTVPACSSCGQQRANLPERDDAGLRVCLSCAARRRSKRCTRCKSVGRVATIEPDGAVCERCYVRDPARHEQCTGCGHRRRVISRRPDGGPVCGSCHRSPARPCSGCGNAAPAVAQTASGPVCRSCYERDHRPRRTGVCGRCGRTATIKVGGLDGASGLCERCSAGGRAVCSNCGRQRFCTGDRGSRPLCHACRPMPTAACVRCRHDRRVVIRWPIGAVCRDCYRWIRSHPAVCPACAQTRVLFALNGDGQVVCGPCGNDERDYLCRECGGGEEIFTGGRCVRCVVRQRVTDLMRRPDGELDPAAAVLVDALSAARRPRSVLQWLSNPNGGAHILRSITEQGTPLTHEALDAAEPGYGVIALRQTLVHAGALPARHEPLERLPRWVDRLLTAAPGRDHDTLRRYAVWSLLRRARRHAARRRFTARSAQHLRNKIHAVIGFALWLDSRNVALAELTQELVDRWLDEGGSHHISGFLHWAAHHGLTNDLQVPRRRPGKPQPAMSEQNRWSTVSRCLKDTTMPTDVRAAGALLLLYGLPVTRIVELRRDQLVEHDGRPHLVIGQHRAVIPPSLARLLAELPIRPPGTAVVADTSSWLFGGRLAGLPISAAACGGGYAATTSTSSQAAMRRWSTWQQTYPL
jgi:hypothetical protein